MANGYHANFHTEKLRSSGRPNSIVFGAADDATAAAVVVELENWTAGQNTSLTKNVFGAYPAYGTASYPGGSRYGFSAIVWDASGNAFRVRWRNINPTIAFGAGDVYACITALLTGAAYATGGIVALSAPPLLPNSGNPVTYVTSVNIIDKA